jgi:bacillithiol biosynthesis cysteine-adding enzyme BshC
MKDVFDGYLANDDALAPFFPAPARDLLASPPDHRPWDQALADELRTYQSHLGGSASFQGTEAAIVTGQQPGLLTGPLYTVYKAMTAILLAQRLEETQGVKCTPVFWLAGDDHDFAEARDTHILTKSDTPLPLRYEPQSNIDNMPLYRVPLEDSLHAIIDQAAQEVRGSELREGIQTFLHHTLDESESFNDWCGRLMARLFQETPLVFFAPHLPSARRLAKNILQQEIANPLASTRLVNETGQRLQSIGYSQQVVKGDTECNFFLETDHRRCKVLFENDTYVIPATGDKYSTNDMAALLDEAPGRFSANVVLRPVLQQRLFPTAAYVGGPGEIAYWAQLKPLFEHFDQPMPIVYPRAQATLLTTKTKKLLTKNGLDMNILMEGSQFAMEKALRNGSAQSTMEVFTDQRQRVLASLDTMASALGKHSKSAQDQALQTNIRMNTQLDRLEQNVLRSDNQQVATAQKQVDRLCNTLAPGRKRQERVYTIFSYVFEHGWGIVPRLMKAMDVTSFSENELEL